MRKKFMLVAALAGILSLGACVDDKESASVEAIRNAKAEQLKSVAAMNNAQAEATRLLAAAEAALKTIEAELEKVRVESYKVQLEIDKLDLESRKASLAVQLAGQQEELEAALLQAKAYLIQAQQDYLNALNGVDEEATRRLKILLADYITEANALVTYKNDLVTLKSGLVSLEYGLVDAKTLKEQKIIGWKNDITYQETQKAIYENYSTVDKAEAKKAYDAANSEYNILSNKATASLQAKNAAVSESNTANSLLTNSAYYNKLSAFIGKTDGGMFIKSLTADYYGYEVTDAFGIITQVQMFTKRLTKSTTVEYIYDDQSYGNTQSYTTITDFFTVKKAGFDAYITAYEKYIKDNQEKAATTAKAAYDLAVIAETAAKAKAEASTATPQDKLDYQAANSDTKIKKGTLDSANQILETVQKDLAEVKAAYAFVTSAEQTAAMKAKVDSYNALSKETCDLTIQNAKDNYVANLKYAEVTALRNIYNAAIDIVSAIQTCDGAIKTLERNIADMSTIETVEKLIESQKVDIANKEVQIAAQEKIAAAAKAAFEAAAN